MKGNPDISKHGVKTQFSSENQPENRGRRPNRFLHLQNQFDLSSDDVKNIISYLLSLNKDEIETLMSNSSTSVIVLAFASAITTSIQKGELNQIETMLTRLIGKPVDRLNVDISSFAEWVKSVTEKQAD